MTAGRLVNLYDLMDSAYDAAEIRAHSRALGHVPIIDVNPRRDAWPCATGLMVDTLDRIHG